MHPLWEKKNKKYGSFSVLRELNQYPEQFQSIYRISKDCFTQLLNMIKTKITKKNTNWRTDKWHAAYRALVVTKQRVIFISLPRHTCATCANARP